MLIVGQCIDGGNLRKFRELLHIRLGKSPNHRAMDHPSHHPRRVPHQLTPAQLNLRRTKETGNPSQLPNGHLKRDPGPGGGFGEDQSPDLPVERPLARTFLSPVFLGFFGQIENLPGLGLSHSRQL